MKNRWLSRLALALVSLTVSVVAAEIILNVMDVPPDREGHQQLFVEYDSLLGWRNIPNATGRISSDEYERDLRYNARSMRGPVLPHEKPAGTLRVLLIGDSFVDGYTEELGERVSDVLERALRASLDAAVEVIAMGTGGYSTDQELLWLEAEGLRYAPDVVVLMFHPNDVWYNTSERYWRGYKPRFVLDEGQLTLTGVPVPPPGTESDDRGVGQRLNGWIRDHSKLYWLVARAVQNHPRLYGFAVRAGLASPSPEMVFDERSGSVVAGEFSVFSADPPQETLEAWRITRELVRRMRERVTDAGADFLTFLVPIRSRIYTQNDEVRSGLAAGNAAIDVNAVVRQFDELCTTHQLPYIDPTDAYLAAADSLQLSGDRLYYRYDWHWNARGHQLAAEILTRYVRPLLSERKQRGGSGGYADYVRRTCGAMRPPVSLRLN
jgi:lysophospholipase L1-like esterase